MLFKSLLIGGILPVVASVLARKLFCDRVVKRSGAVPVSMTGVELAQAILRQGKAEEVKIEEKRRPFLPLSSKRLIISPALASSREAKDVAAAGLLAGLVLIARQQEKVFRWRKWAVKFGWSMPAFTTMAVVFGVLARTIPAGWAVGIVAAMIGLAALILWLTLPVEREAAKTVVHYLEETRIVSRRAEAERLSELVRALAWQRLVPGCVEWLIPKPKGAIAKDE